MEEKIEGERGPGCSSAARVINTSYCGTGDSRAVPEALRRLTPLLLCKDIRQLVAQAQEAQKAGTEDTPDQNWDVNNSRQPTRGL